MFSFLKLLKKNIKKKSLAKTKQKLLLLIPENIGDRLLSACKTKISTEYREKGIRCFNIQIFQTYQFS